MRDEIRLIMPSIEYETAVNEYVKEFTADGTVHIDGAGGVERYPDYSQWLEYNERERHPETVSANHIIADTFFAVRVSDGKLIGMINCRYALTDHLLRVGGHIGYGVRPGERKKGYATEMLRLALDIYRKRNIDPVLVTCNESNTASARTIERNGGVYESSEVDEDDGAPTRRYWIKL